MPNPSVSLHPFGAAPDLGPARLYTLTNASGISVTLTDYGATWVGWMIPEKTGRRVDVVLGFENAADYAAHHAYFGAVCGRHANRIAGGAFTLDGRSYTLAVNNGPNHLHGGKIGFDRHLWNATVAGTAEEPSVTFSRRSPDGEEGYPGNLDVAVTYTLTAEGGLRLDYHATTDAATVLNLTNHAYFNLGGHNAGDCLDHTLRLAASHYLPTDATAIPTGEIRSVADTPFDFLTGRTIGERIENRDTQLGYGRGYDHCFVVDGIPETLRLAAELTHAPSGRTLVVETTEPGLQVYTGNWIVEAVGDTPGKSGARYGMRAGVALETQRFPDAPNRPAFRGVILRPGEHYRSTTRFGIRHG